MKTNNDKKKDKSSNGTWLAIVLGIGGTVGLVAVARSRSSDDAKTKAKGKSGETKSPSLVEVAATLRRELLTLEGCAVTWKLGEASRTALIAHQADFFVPAIADARAKGMGTVDEITAHVAGLLVPGCPWPPPIIQNFDLEAAVAGELPMIQEQMWTIAQAMGAVQLYLTIRSVVASAMANRRG
jgi:hypothetical protein